MSSVSPDKGDCVPTQWEPTAEERVPAGQGAEPGRVIILNTLRMAIWHLTAAAGPEEVPPDTDLLNGPLMPGGGQAVELPRGRYRFVAETGGGSPYRSPLISLAAGGVARWSIGERRDA